MDATFLGGIMHISFTNCEIKIYNQIILKDVSFCMSKQHFIHIKGTNGSGKTVFLETVLGFHKKVVGEYSLNISKERICYIPDTSFFIDDERVSDILDTYKYFYKVDFQKLKEACLLLDLNVEGILKQKVCTLSQGMKKKLEILPLFFTPFSLYVLDEITTGLDMEAVLIVGNRIQTLFHRGASFIFTEHNQNVVDYYKFLINTMEVYQCVNQKLFKSL